METERKKKSAKLLFAMKLPETTYYYKKYFLADLWYSILLIMHIYYLAFSCM